VANQKRRKEIFFVGTEGRFAWLELKKTMKSAAIDLYRALLHGA